LREKISKFIWWILKRLHGLMLLAIGCLTGICAAAGFPEMMREYFHKEIPENDSILILIWLFVWFFMIGGFSFMIDVSKKKDKKK